MDTFVPKLKIDIDGTVEAECLDVELPRPEPQKFDWIQHTAERDIREMEEALTLLGNHLEHMRWRAAQDSKALEELRQEKWRDEELQDMKRQRDEAIQDNYRGFPITKEESDKIYKWIQDHDTNIHANPSSYHGASGGGYEYVFYPTGLGTAADCICSACKSRAIREAGALWYDKLKELGGVFEFQELG